MLLTRDPKEFYSIFFICSYHQKYIMQKHEWLMSALNLKRGQELIDSVIATRLNGYLGGYGEKES